MKDINDLQNEGGEGFDHNGSDATKSKKPLTDWTIEVTINRRAEWNDAVKTGRGKLTPRDIANKIGFSMRDLQQAVEFHSL